MSISMIFLPSYLTIHLPLLSNVPIIDESTPRRTNSSCNFFHFDRGTAKVIRSCDSEIHICQGSSPGYFRGTFSSCTSQPPDSFAISAIEQERPPAPLSVMLLKRFRSLASFTIASLNFFWV